MTTPAIAATLIPGDGIGHVGQVDPATRLRRAIDLALNQDCVRTRDLGGMASTQEFGQAVIKRLAA